MLIFLQQLANGISLGALYALFGLGFGLIFANLGILHIAYGTVTTWGALFTLWAIQGLHLSYVAGFAAAILGCVILSVMIDQVAFQPLRRRNDEMTSFLVASIAIWIILGSAALIATGARYSSYPASSFPAVRLNIGGVILSWAQWVTIMVALIATVSLELLLRRTPVGTAIRAVSYSPRAAALSGVNTRYTIVIIVGISGILAGAAGVLGGLSTQSVSFQLGEGLLLKGFAAVVVGGYGDIRGTAIGGLLIGLIEVFTGQYLSGSFSDAVTFGLLLVFLVYRPRGLFGKTEMVERA